MYGLESHCAVFECLAGGTREEEGEDGYHRNRRCARIAAPPPRNRAKGEALLPRSFPRALTDGSGKCSAQDLRGTASPCSLLLYNGVSLFPPPHSRLPHEGRRILASCS